MAMTTSNSMREKPRRARLVFIAAGLRGPTVRGIRRQERTGCESVLSGSQIPGEKQGPELVKSPGRYLSRGRATARPGWRRAFRERRLLLSHGRGRQLVEDEFPFALASHFL